MFLPDLTLSFQPPSDDETRATPSTAMYGIEGVKALANALESVSDFIPLPFLSTFLKVGVKVLEACEVCVPFFLAPRVILPRIGSN
jgi:hypothetical protein